MNEQGVSKCPMAGTQCPSPKKELARAIIQCHIHLGKVDDPRILHCGHSFCLECLRALAQKESVSGLLLIVCPLCRRHTKVENCDQSLIVNFALCDLLEIFDAEEREEQRVLRELLQEADHTVTVLNSLRDKCSCPTVEDAYSRLLNVSDLTIAVDGKLELLSRRTEKLRNIKDIGKHEAEIKNLQFTCLAYQRFAEGVTGELSAQPIGIVSHWMQNFSFWFQDVLTFDYRSAETMSERRSQVWFNLIVSTLLTCSWRRPFNIEFAGAVAAQIGRRFSEHFDQTEGVWVAIFGRRPLGCWIVKNDHDYGCLNFAQYRLVVYRRDFDGDNLDSCKLTNGQSDNGHAAVGYSVASGQLVSGLANSGRSALSQLTAGHPTSGHSTSGRSGSHSSCSSSGYASSSSSSDKEQTRFDSLLAEALRLKHSVQDLNVAKYIRERLQDGQWHVTAGHSGDFSIATYCKGRPVDVPLRSSSIGDWTAVIYEG